MKEETGRMEIGRDDGTKRKGVLIPKDLDGIVFDAESADPPKHDFKVPEADQSGNDGRYIVDWLAIPNSNNFIEYILNHKALKGMIRHFGDEKSGLNHIEYLSAILVDPETAYDLIHHLGFENSYEIAHAMAEQAKNALRQAIPLATDIEKGKYRQTLQWFKTLLSDEAKAYKELCDLEKIMETGGEQNTKDYLECNERRKDILRRMFFDSYEILKEKISFEYHQYQTPDDGKQGA